MLASERIIEIEKLVHKNGKVTVTELVELFNVTPDLIRKDLRKFEHNDQIQRVHGGAILKRSTPKPSNIEARMSLGVEEKKHIAKKAIELISEKDIIFLDISSTSLYIATELKNIDHKLTVITNMLAITQCLQHNEFIDVISIGGTYDRYLGGYIDNVAQEQVKQFITDIAFVGTGGLDATKDALSIHNIADGEMKRQIISMSKQPYIVATQNHFSIDGRYIFDYLSNVSGVITDFTVTEDIINSFNDAEIDLIY